MSEWIPVSNSLPPVCRSVLLYIVFLHEDGISLWDDQILAGFYGDEDYDKKGFYLDTISEDGFSMKYNFIEECDQVKVIAWTLLPRKPYNPKFDREGWSW